MAATGVGFIHVIPWQDLHCCGTCLEVCSVPQYLQKLSAIPYYAGYDINKASMKNKIDIPFMIEPIWIEHDYCENTGEKFLPYPGFKDRGGCGARFKVEEDFRCDLSLLFLVSRLSLMNGYDYEAAIESLINASNVSMGRT